MGRHSTTPLHLRRSTGKNRQRIPLSLNLSPQSAEILQRLSQRNRWGLTIEQLLFQEKGARLARGEWPSATEEQL